MIENEITAYCSFCGKNNTQVTVIVKGKIGEEEACICNECVKLAQELVDEFVSNERVTAHGG